MDTVNILYTEVNIISLIIMFTVFIKSLGFSRMESQKDFIHAMGAQIGFALSDTVFVLFHRGMLPPWGPALMVFKSAYFLMSVVMVYMWYHYFQMLQGNPVHTDRMKMFFLSLPILVMIYILIANLFNRALFYLDENGQFQQGPWFLTAQYTFPFIYVYLICNNSIQCAYRNRHVPEGRLYLLHSGFPLLLSFTSIIQVFFPQIPLTNIALALVTLLMYVNSLDEAVSIDTLTQLPNRRQFMKQMNLWFATRNEAIPMYFMILDVDKFKHVNDRYGHTEGDAALVRVANALRVSCGKQRKKSVIGRYGGDEFMLLVEAAGEDEIKKLIIQIERTLKESDEEAKSPYKLSVSVGYARLDEKKSIKEVIDLADERQYEVKKVHHRIIEEESGQQPTES